MKKLLNHLTQVKFSNSNGFTLKDLEDRAVLMGVVAEILLSKEMFSRNEELKKFIFEVFNLELLDYLYRSRTLLLSRIIRTIELSSKENLTDYILKVSSFLENQTRLKDTHEKTNEGSKEKKINKRSKRKSTLETIDSWRRIINKDHE